jgi:hypothetical protein
MTTHLKGSFRSAIIHHEENAENGYFDIGAISGLASCGRVVPHLAQSSLLSSFSKP